MARELAVIIPTFKERENLRPVVERLHTVLEGWDWEVIFVDDDSPDGSLEELLALSREDSRVRFLRRVGRRGLSSACIEGMCATSAPLLAVMDADLQHDETLLPAMATALREDRHLDLAVGTRYARDGGVGEWSRRRHALSRLATLLEKLVLRTELSDPMSGFFVIRREAFEGAVRRVSAKGFKVLLDLVSSSPTPLKIREFPYVFRPRQRGESKLDVLVGLEYLYLLAEKLLGGLVPVRFFIYSLVGLSGVGVHLAALALAHRTAGMEFGHAQALATGVAMTSNFLLNNWVTFRNQRLKGPLLLPGLLFYVVICSVGAAANVGVALYVKEFGMPWWFAGVVGASIGAVWNYAVSKQIVWTWFRDKLQSRGARRAATLNQAARAKAAMVEAGPAQRPGVS